MTYLITGGAGFVGSHVAEQMLQRGERVVVIDNFNDYYEPAIKRGNAERLRQYDALKLIEGDIRDVALVERLFAEEGITRVAHLAAMPGVRASVRQVRLYMDVNLTGTMNLLEASKSGRDRAICAGIDLIGIWQNGDPALCRNGYCRSSAGGISGQQTGGGVVGAYLLQPGRYECDGAALL